MTSNTIYTAPYQTENTLMMNIVKKLQLQGINAQLCKRILKVNITKQLKNTRD